VAPIPVPAPDSIRYLENYFFDLSTGVLWIDACFTLIGLKLEQFPKSFSATMIFFYKISSSLWKSKGK
jgi:hypothetical protein